MKTVNFKKIYLFSFLLMTSCFAFSQWEEAQLSIYFSLPEIALIDIEPSLDNDVHFTVNPGVESGGSPSIQKSGHNNIWINYSSSLSGPQNSRSIVAEVSQGIFPEGITLYLEASNYSGSGGGQHGQTTGRVAISNQPKPIITNIGNGFTGDGINNGHSITFSIEISDYTKVVSVEDSNFLVLYTITDN
jgi:hypothetical protein